jgi:hypothetical protein
MLPEKLMRALLVMKCPASWSLEIFVVFIIARHETMFWLS